MRLLTRKTKNSTLALGALAVFVIAIVASIQLGWLDISQTPAGSIIPNGNNNNPTAPPSSGQVSVTKTVKIVATDKFAGGNPTGTTNAIRVYDSDGKTVLETLSLSSGSCTTSNSYQSGKQLWIRYYYDTTIDEYMWTKITVPQMNAADAESLTTNTVTIKTFTSPAATDALQTGNGITITDGYDFNTSSSGNETGTLTYQWFVTSDNTGFIGSTDPIYNLALKPMIWATLTGTGYETISLSGFDGAFEKGSTMYYYKVLQDTQVTKYKVGNDYVYNGAGSFTFSYNAVGYTAANTTTLQLYTRLYANEDYMKQYGDYGPYDFQLTEQTMDFYTYT